MGTFNSPMQSMTWEEDGVYQAAAAASHATEYTCTDYTGSGKLLSMGWYQDGETAWDCYNTITIDGNAHTWDGNVVNLLCGLAFCNSQTGGKSITVPLGLEFQTSLLVKFANDAAGAHILAGQTMYGILSEEYHREIILAGQPLPNRDYVYPFDVMLVHFCEKVVGGQPEGHRSNKIQFPQAEVVDIGEGKVFALGFNTTVKAQRYDRTLAPFNGTKQITLEDEVFDLPVVNGIIQANKIPFMIGNRDFWNRFTNAEQETLVGHANAKVQSLLFDIRLRAKINLRWPKLVAALNAMESAGILSAGRAAQILTV